MKAIMKQETKRIMETILDLLANAIFFGIPLLSTLFMWGVTMDIPMTLLTFVIVAYIEVSIIELITKAEREKVSQL